MSVKKIHLCQQFASSIDEREKSNNCIKWLLQFDLLERGKKKPKYSRCSIVKDFDDAMPFLRL